ncbi:nonribosomal siderophore peptide synthase SidC [Pochonia chlamydosporia 170]|uniref:Nonribosomal siderophore peptide synthase SidC n=1 Tax=Pochonia chlamydosporia 170 TaxID=1380566 RepID=A0A179F8A4_METCM|nr:nonribosomal siderophore peptide synthase SidC [Pochonia chlamydosporia 170]OAQ61393.1 nonribosomal siderophore peptide synthase SidC [Pochonia chlamydosporia 170]
MQDAKSAHRPPVTRLRPLHTRNEVDKKSLSALLSWTSSLGTRTNKNTILQGFVKLVSQIIIVDSGEAFCIQYAALGGYIHARAGEDNQDGSYTFVHHGEGQGDICTDFSIGSGKSLQLHMIDGRIELMAQASMIPQPALDALGQMLQDIILHLQKSPHNTSPLQWTQPSVLNHPPQDRPIALWPGENQAAEPALLHRRFEQRVRDFPQRVALDFLTDLETGKRTQYTYQQVSNIATALALDLYQTSCKSNAAAMTVAVHMGPCPELYVSYIAALKVGLAFCPIPIDAPYERKAALLEDLKPVAVLEEESGGPLKNVVESIGVTRYLDACDVEPQRRPSFVSPSETDAAYILYTSGTTGIPKGVIISHISAACTISALSNHYGFCTPGSLPSHRPVRWFQGAAPTFDISLFEIFWTLSTGSTLCCAARHLTMQDVDKVVTTLEADITNVTPSFASLIDPRSMRGLMVGGETLNTRLLQDFSCYNPSTKDTLAVPRGIYNGYGPTEVTIYSVAQAHVPKNQRGSVIGTPLLTCGVLIVDTEAQGLEPVPMGADGELVLTGAQVSRTGYLNRPEETTKVFIDDPKWGRAYRTGDRARIVWNEQGEALVEFLGRISDGQVKLSGRRVELGEIESVLASKVKDLKQVLACVWKPKNGSLGSEKVVSLVVVDPKSALSFEVVKSQCLEAAPRQLPEYMVPVHFLQVDTLPQSTSGKVDRKAASAYVQSILHQSRRSEAQGLQEGFLEQSEDATLEADIIKILSDIICDDSALTHSLKATTLLSEAGVDSLCAMRLLRDIRNLWPDSKHLQPSLGLLLDPKASIRSVFGSASAGLAMDKTRAQRQIADFASRHTLELIEKLGSIGQADIEMVLPATSTQSQLAVSFAMDRRNYVSHTILPLRENVSLEALEEAVNDVLCRQAIYRCALVSCDDELSPFSLVVLKPDAWHRWTADSRRVVRRQGTTTDGAQECIELAHQYLDLESQKLFYIQIVESEGDSGLVVISLAHCLCDGASLEVLLSDISREYTGLDPLPRLGIEDAVLDWVSCLDTETDKQWREALRGWEVERFRALSGNNINSSNPGVPADYGHAMVQIASDLQWQTLEASCKALGASPLSVLQASWSLLLQIFSEANTGDIVFGSVISGQHEATHAPTFSVAPCRVALPDRQTVGELLDSLIRGSRFAQRHRHMSFGTFETLPYNTALALQAYSPPKAGSDQFRTQDAAVVVPWAGTGMRNPAIRYDFDIFVEVFPADPGPLSDGFQTETMSFKLTYRNDALSYTSARVIVKQLEAMTKVLLNSKADDLVQTLPARLPRGLLSAEGTIPLPMEEPQERIQLLHAQFEKQAAATPDLLALSFYTALDAAPVELTYAELDVRANGLANILREEDVDIIPICIQRSVELYISILAILKAGSAWSPIDETSPIQRRTSLIARTQGKVLLTNTNSFHLVEPCLAHESLAGVRVILVDQYVNHKTSVRAAPRRSIQVSRSDIGGQDLAYLLWTSGTTGEPKGVMIQHFAAANAMRDLQVQVERDETVGQVQTLQLSSYSFDVFVQDLFFTWGVAGSVISGTRELILGTFTEFVNKSRPTHAHLTPSFGASIDVEEIRGSTLQYVTFIGEKLTEDVAEAWAAPGITTKAYNTYGPAENAVVSTMRRFFGKSRDQAKAANVGFPLATCTAYVVRQVENQDDAQKKKWELVPRYGVGELALGGGQVGKGYLNDEAKTSRAFIQGGHRIGERIYLTGDMVRLNDHGFEFLGRNDDLVKITGIRIELSEISAACATVKDAEPGVEHLETLYLPRPGACGGDDNHKVVVTFVSIKRDGVDTARVRTQVFQKAREVLPAYMIPGHVVVLDTTMPRTASNKVDRKALQNIYNKANLYLAAGREVVAGDRLDSKVEWPEDQLHVVKAIAENFKVPVEPLSPDDSLASLGFSSLQVTKLAWALRRQLKCTVGVLDLMRCQTLGELVDVVLGSIKKTKGVEAKVDQASEGSLVRLLKRNLTKNLHGDMRPKSTSYILPATPVQESLLVETMVETGAYWSHRIFDLSHISLVDSSRLKASWSSAATQFDILRTVFAPLSELSVHNDSAEIPNTTQWARQQGVHATMVQLILNKPIIHWTTLSNADTEGLTTIAEKIQVTLAPLGTNRSNPPWAVTFSEGNNKMMLSMHHTLHDGVASSMILESVASLYLNPEQISETYNAALQMERGMELGLLPSISQRDEALSAWTKRLHGLVEADGALNGPFPDLTGSRQKQKQTILSVKQTIPGRLLEHRAGEPDLPRLVQSAFGCALAGTLELKTIVLGQTVSQRILHPDIARVVGPAMATLPVIVRAHASSAEELWADMGFDASSLSQSAHRLHPVDIKKIVNEGSGHRHAPFPALFVYHPTATADDDHIDVGVDMFREIGQALPLNVEHPMALNIFEADSTIELTGDARLISQPMLELMLDQILDQARAMLDHPRMPLKQLSNHMNRELMSICGKIGSLVGTDITRNPADLVTKQAAEHPDWIAVEEISLEDGNDEDDQIVSKVLTYAELEVLVNAIATALRSHESKPLPDDVVALYLGRDTKSLAAILATFKCGYMYLPIDGDLPAARKQLLVRDANAKLVLTTQGLVGDLNLDSSNDPPALFLPEGDDELEVIRTWPNAFSKAANAITTGEGGYLLYTSGSTGRPKGVSVTNESLLHFISAMTKRLIEANVDTAHLGGVGKYLNVASRAFDTHLTSMFAPWHLGFRSVIGKDRNAIFASLQQVINKVKITHMGSVPSVLMQLGLRLEDVPSMRVLTFGGEKASHELFEQLNTGNPKAALMNFYGPTEVTIGCLSHIVGPHSNSRNLGVPLRGLEAILLVAGDDGEQVVARKGQPGEFCIAGPQVAVGYLDRPEENAKGFQYTRLLGGGGEKRIYRTGDIMRMMHDGSLEFLGRRDQQTKIRGQRFEISEVEAYIKKTVVDQGPLDVAATVVDQRLVGFLARKKNTLLKAELNAEPELLAQDNKALQGMLPYIEQACREGLPAFMVPEMMWVSKIPYLAASGKTDSKSLIKLANDFMALQQGFQVNATSAPHPSKEHGATPSLSNAELEVVAALQEVVGCQVTCTAVSTSSIRSLGIDSLLGVHLIMVLKKRGFVKATMVDLLSPSCTVGSLARTAGADVTYTKKKTSPMKELLSWTLNDLGPNASSLNGVNVAAVLPCLPLQSPLVALSLNWLDSVSDEENSEADMDVPYVTQFNYQLAPGTDVAQWKAVATKVVFSEAILRTCFIRREEDGKIFQVVLKSPPSPFDGKDDAAAIVAQISSQPPIRLQIQSDQESGKIIVLLKIHHALSKAVAFENQSLHSLQRLANHCHLTEEEIQSVKRSWQTKLRGIQPCRIGRDTEEGTTDTTVRVRKHLAYTSTELKAKLQQGEPVSMSTAFQLATSLCLAYLTKRPSVAYGFTMSLRPLLRHVTQDVDDFVGPCLNTVVHTLTLEGASETLPKLAQKVHQGHVDACQGHMPLVTADKIQQWANLKEKLFDSLLTINVIPTEDESSGARCTPGHMTPLPGKSRGDLALAIDVDLHADGMIVLSLASAGAMTEAQLEEVGILFEKIVFSSSNKAATVEQFASVKYETTDLVSNGIVNTKSTISRPQPLSKGFESALACVQSAACHLLHLDVAEMQAKSPETTSLYQLGIDSINVLPFVKLIHKAEGIKLAPNALIRARTVQGVAALLHQAKSQSDVLIINGDKKGRKDGEVVRSDKSVGNQVPYEQTLQQLAYDLLFIATPLQEGMLSASMAIAEQAYMYTHTMQLSQVALEQDTPNFDHFFAAVKDTVHACEILRSRFIFTQNDDAPWVGVVSPTEQSDLVNWYVSKAGLVQLTIHHALYDAVSIQAVWRLLNENYRKRLTGEEEDQDDQQVAEYLFRSFAKSSALAQKSAVAFWTSTVHDYTYEPVEIAEESLHASSSFYFTLADTELLSLQTKCREANATLKAAMQLGWAKVLCESLYKQADVVFGEVITASGEDSEALVIGPVINTIPVRLNLTSQSGASSIHEAMSQLQTLGDNARGANGMASLRAIQRAWRSSRANGVNTAAGLFQSLFVFDGVIASEREKPSQDLLVPVRSQVHDDVKAGEKGPAYDDYPFIVSFRIKDGTLHGALRAKLSEEKVNDLGKLLENALRYLASEKLQISVLDLAHLHLADISRANESEPAKNIANTNTSGVDMNALTGQADAVLEIVKEVVRVKIRWKGIGYKTKLVNIGLDSISAIRFSKILKKKLGLRVSVFEIIRGASVEDIARKSASVEMNGFQQPNGQLPIYQVRGLEGLVADKLGLVEKQIKSVSPVLSGQRHTLQQWLHNGKRFFEAPWVYRIHDESVGTEKVASYWVRLSQVHEILRTTFVYTGDTSPQLVQVTLDESVSVASRFSMVLDTTISIQELIQKHVREGNAKPSNLKEPPARLSLLKSFDGIAVVFRVHHALYDAWSIKMILKDLTRLFANESLQPHPSIQLAVREITNFRQPEAEKQYWKMYLSEAQDTIVHSGSVTMTRLGPHFKAAYTDILPRDVADGLDCATNSKACTSAAIIIAYAHALGELTGCVQPIFGLNHSSRSLTSAKGEHTLDLTAMSVPTMAVVPLTVDLKARSKQQLFEAVQDHLAQLTKFAQADNLQKLSPKFNSYINILYSNEDVEVESQSLKKAQVLQRHKLGEPLASEYFTQTAPSSIVSTVDGLDTSAMHDQQFYFNILVHQNGNISVNVSGNEDFLRSDQSFVTKFMENFGRELWFSKPTGQKVFWNDTSVTPGIADG